MLEKMTYFTNCVKRRKKEEKGVDRRKKAWYYSQALNGAEKNLDKP